MGKKEKRGKEPLQIGRKKIGERGGEKGKGRKSYISRNERRKGAEKRGKGAV